LKIVLGDEDELCVREKIQWIRSNLDKDLYVIRTTGFLITEYFVEFVDEKYATLYLIRYPK
jgi:hypothetical protein